MTKPLISVIIPTYKRFPERISRSVASVQNQTYENLEIVIVDDSPVDFEGRSLVKLFVENLSDPRIKYIQHEKNLGANFARNTGIKNSNGVYCAFLDDDDEWINNKLELQLEKFNKDDSVGLVYCKASIVNEKDSSTGLMFNELHSGNQYHRLLKQNFIGSNSYVLIKKSIFNDIGFYDEKLLSNQDYDLFLRIAKKYKIDYVDEILVKYYMHSGERISSNYEKLLQGRLGVYNKFKNDIDPNKELSNIWKLKLIPILYGNGNIKEAIMGFITLGLKSPIFTMKYLVGTLKHKFIFIQAKKRF